MIPFQKVNQNEKIKLFRNVNHHEGVAEFITHDNLF